MQKENKKDDGVVVVVLRLSLQQIALGCLHDEHHADLIKKRIYIYIYTYEDPSCP